MKLKQNKNILAIITAASILTLPKAYATGNNLEAFYDEKSFNIRKDEIFTLKITKQKLEELIKEDNPITIKIERQEIEINKQELIKLKEKADRYEKENIEYSLLICLIGGLTLTTIFAKETLNKKYIR